MKDIEKAGEAYEIASLILARMIVKEGLNNEKSEVKVFNELYAPIKLFIQDCKDFKNSSSIKRTNWENYRRNANEFIDLAKRLAGQ